MTDHFNTRGGDDVHTLSGAYAVDALDEQERARFEAHLDECQECRDEVDGLTEAAMHFSIDETAPSAAVRDAVLAGIQNIRPLPPVVTEIARPTADAPGSDPAEQPAEQTDELAKRRAARVTPAVKRFSLVAAAVAALVMAAGAVWLKPWADDQRGPEPEPRLTAAEKVLAADDAQRVEKQFPDGSSATVVVSRDEGQAVIRTDDMEPAPDGRSYQLWLQTPAGEMEPAGLMPDLRDATMLLEGDAARSTGVGITVEPDGGSEQPTSEPIAFFNLET